MTDDYEKNNHRAHLCGYAVVAGLVLEIVVAAIWFHGWQTSIDIAAVALIALGVWGEIAFGNRARLVGDKQMADAQVRIAEANERAAKADLARVELENKLRPRELNQNQWDLIQSFKGQFDQINVAFETNAETRWFANRLLNAIHAAGIKGAIMPRAADAQSYGHLIFEPKGFEGARPRTVQPLIELFKLSDPIPLMAVVTGVPTDIVELAKQLPYDASSNISEVPMIIVGGHFIMSPDYYPKMNRVQAKPGSEPP